MIGIDPAFLVLVVPALLFSLYAQWKVTSTFRKYSEFGTRRGLTGAEVAVPLEGLIDFDKERARLEKEIGKLTNELAGLEKRLGNPDFIARAAADVVAESRARATELADQITRLKATIDAL